MAHSQLINRYWDDMFSSVIYLINRQPSTNNSSSLFFTLFNKLPDYSFLWVLGCLCFSYTRPYNDHKLQLRSKPCVFFGYSLSQKGYKCLLTLINFLCLDMWFLMSCSFHSKSFRSLQVQILLRQQPGCTRCPLAILHSLSVALLPQLICMPHHPAHHLSLQSLDLLMCSLLPFRALLQLERISHFNPAP